MATIQAPIAAFTAAEEKKKEQDKGGDIPALRMARLRSREITPEVKAAMEAGGFFAEGFTGGTVGEYQQWFQGEFGFDPLAAGLSFSGGELGVHPGASFFQENPLGFSEEQGFTGLPTTELGIAQQQFLEQRMGVRREEEERERGIGMLNWLMGQAAELSGTQFAQLASVAGPLAQERFGYQAGTTDPSGILGVMSQQEQRRIAEQEREAAAGFDFTRDVLPSLITGGLSALGGS